MTFSDWQQFAPEEAAREIYRRVHELPTDQRRAIVAALPSERALEEGFVRSNRSAALGGVPYFLKDLFDVPGLPTLAGSTFLPEVRSTPAKESQIVTRLRAMGGVMAGKVHLHEFAYGITGENPHYGDCVHPRFPDRTTGGSSSGSAASVAAGIVPFAIGTDTGGSVRVPAAFCGLYGFRSAPHDALIADAVPLSQTFDTAGWFTANAGDMSTLLTAMFLQRAAKHAPRGGYLELPGLDPEVAQAFQTSAAHFASPVDASTRGELLPAFSNRIETYSNIVATEAWRFHQNWAETYRERYDPAVWQRLQRGATVTPALYDSALAECATLRAVWAKYFATFDFLILPATPFGALTKAECTVANRNRLLSLTAPASLGGCPVLTIPIPLASGLTSGLQIVVNDVRSPAIAWALTLDASRVT